MAGMIEQRASKVARASTGNMKENHTPDAPVSFEGTASDLGAMMAGLSAHTSYLSAAKAAAVRASGVEVSCDSCM